MIKAVSFDFWGTLFRDAFGRERGQYRAKAILDVVKERISLEDALEALSVVGREFSRCHIEEQRTLTPEDAVDIVCLNLGLELHDKDRKYLAEEFATAILVFQPEPIENALEAVRYTAQFVPVGLISDTGISPGSSLKQLLEIHGFTEYITSYRFSDEEGVSKPQSVMFEKTAVELGVQPEELLHIGDLELTDIIGIKQLGGKACLFTGATMKYLGRTIADFQFSDWLSYIQELPNILNHYYD
ncbi:MAG TPA: HAD family hydrolase [Candidatus Hydrogenedens sp.]|nr:HAD family hydrolase [Candidatus Hydrogenedens sp.]HOK10342.1 HAD family hydrolase [Candidatus Hydrogenedens sp.]HOL20898.1 HAD family hydrolase [Candidatus Hydrogenedens sp.]HPP59876.1 HAD family hydrolase [Candidatus Hydrogenedens sp.]